MGGGSKLRNWLVLVGVILVVYNFVYNIPINRPPRIRPVSPTGRPGTTGRPVKEDLQHVAMPHGNPPPQEDQPQEDPPQEDPPHEDPPPATGSIAVTPRRTHRADVGSCAPDQVLSRSLSQDHGLDVPHRPLNWLVPPSAQWPEASCSPSALCVELGRAAGADRQVLLVVADAGSGAQLDSLVESAKAAGVGGQLLVAALDDAAAAQARQLGCGGVWRVPAATLAAAPSPRARKYLVAAAVVAAGVSVVYADLRVSLSADPFGYLFGDADVEAASSGRGNADRGHMRVAMDPSMGWSQMCESYEIAALNPNFWYMAATTESHRLLTRLAARLTTPDPADSADLDEAYVLTEELIAPAHDGTTRAGASLRVSERQCFSPSGKLATVPSADDSAPTLPNSKLLDAREFLSKPQVVKHGCTNTANVPPGPLDADWVAPPVTLPRPRALNWVVPPAAEGGGDATWPSPAVCAEHGLEKLCETVAQVAVRREVLAAVSNKNIFHMLQLYVDGIQKGAKVPNAMVVALDEPTAEWCKARNVAHYTKVLTSRTGSTDNHATSGLKFKVLVDFLTIGCSVLLSDVDVLWMTNPFPHLYRDADVEGMSDGWDEKTAFGHNAGSGTVQLHARNSGMFFLLATRQSLAMVTRLARRMEHEGTWDQSAWNQEQFLPAYGSHKAVGVSTRVMNYLCNLNSKTFFRFIREDSTLLHGYTPLSIHINYHPEKPDRMKDVHRFYYEKYDTPDKGIWRWNGGEGTKLLTECRKIDLKARPDASDADVARVRGKKLEWGGCSGCLSLEPDGTLTTSWGKGRWGKTSTASFKDVIFAKFVDVVHLLKLDESGAFLSTRCSDGEELRGNVMP